jgi:para-nitrobenzyl esterase
MHERIFLTIFVLSALIGCESRTPVVFESLTGPVEGRIFGKVGVFKGIPYAKPPMGSLRWHSPVPMEPWSEPWYADQLGSKCPQLDLVKSYLFKTPFVWGEEDCLYLNIFTPKTDPQEDIEPKPVLVFFHGGAHELGDGNGMGRIDIYDGTKLVELTDIVVVTFNHRLGLLGFMGHRAFNEDSTTGVGSNWALQDQIALLQWVKKNIASFGGDPGNVTIGGESAGGNAVYTLLATKAAEGLFHKAILQSAPLSIRSRDETERAEKPLVRRLMCEGSSGDQLKECLRNLAFEEIVRLQPGVGGILFEDQEVPGLEVSRQEMYYANSVDGVLVDRVPMEDFRRETYAKVPVMVGTNTQELDFILSTGFPAVERYMASLLGPEIKQPATKKATGELITNVVFHCRAREVVRTLQQDGRHDVYKFVLADAPWKHLTDKIGQFHGIDLFYLFQHFNFAEFYSPESFNLQIRMAKYWKEFMATGNPNHMASPVWMPYDIAKDNHMLLDRKSGMGKEFRADACAKLRTDYPQLFANERPGQSTM